jgi:hypothetical protein
LLENVDSIKNAIIYVKSCISNLFAGENGVDWKVISLDDDACKISNDLNVCI